jgi:hypothetical protein
MPTLCDEDFSNFSAIRILKRYRPSRNELSPLILPSRVTFWVLLTTACTDERG